MPYWLDIDKHIYRWQVENQRRLTYTELAKKAGISLSSLHRLKTEPVVRPDLDTLDRLAAVLGIATLDLIVRTEPASNKAKQKKRKDTR